MTLAVNHLDGFGVFGGTPSANGVEVTPTMTTNSAPAGYTTSASSEALGAAYLACDKNNGTIWITGNTGQPWYWQIQFPTATLVWSMLFRASGSAAARGPLEFTVKGSNDGAAFTTVYTAPTQSAWSASEERTFNFSSTDYYSYWRFTCTSTSGNTYMEAEEIKLYS
jgi:hypothetical protein